MAYFKIIQNIIVRESNLVKFQGVASSLDAQYFNYAILRLKASARKQNTSTYILDEKRDLIKKLQMELIVTLAHVRGSSVTVIESIRYWRTTKKPLNSSRIEVTASIFLGNENYLLKMNTDFEIICEEYYTLKLWLGFHPNSLILPEYDEDQVNAYRMRAMLLHVSDQNQNHQNDKNSSSALSNIRSSFSLSPVKQVQVRSFSIPSPLSLSLSLSPTRKSSVPISPLIRRKSDLNLNPVEMKYNNNNNINNNNINNNNNNINNDINSESSHDVNEKSSAAIIWENENYENYLLWMRRKQDRQSQREKQRKSNGQHHFLENQNVKPDCQFSINSLLSSLLSPTFPASNVRQLYGHGTVDFIIFPDENLNSNNPKFEELKKKLHEEISLPNSTSKIVIDNVKKDERKKTSRKQLLPFSCPESASDSSKKDFFGKSGIDSTSSRYASDVLEKKLTRGGSFLGTDVRNNHHMNNARSDNNFKNDINNNKNDNNNSMTNKNNKNNNFINNLKTRSNSTTFMNQNNKLLTENSNLNLISNLNAEIDKIFQDTEKWIKILKFVSRLSWGEKKSKNNFHEFHDIGESNKIKENNEIKTTDLLNSDKNSNKSTDNNFNNDIIANKTEMIHSGIKKYENEDENKNKCRNKNEHEKLQSKQGLKECPEFWSNLDLNSVLIEAATGFIELYPNQPLVPPLTETFYNEMKELENFLWNEKILFDSMIIRKHNAAQLKEEVERRTDIDSIKVRK